MDLSGNPDDKRLRPLGLTIACLPLAYSLPVLTTAPLFHADVFSAASRGIFLSHINADFFGS
jgi:hypothetical protein